MFQRAALVRWGTDAAQGLPRMRSQNQRVLGPHRNRWQGAASSPRVLGKRGCLLCLVVASCKRSLLLASERDNWLSKWSERKAVSCGFYFFACLVLWGTSFTLQNLLVCACGTNLQT